MIVRLVLWSLADSKTTLDELRAHLPALRPPSVWISDEATERSGLLAFGEPPPLGRVVELIGLEPLVAEDFDVEGAP